MQEKSTSEVPVIDLSLVEEAAAEAVRQACTRFGFFSVRNHGISQELVQATMEMSRRFFEQPLDKKLALKFNANFRGYTPMAAETIDLKRSVQGDTKESFFLGHRFPDWAPGMHNTLGDDGNQWPSEEDMSGFNETMRLYMQEMVSLGERVQRLLSLALGLPAEYLAQRLDHPQADIRLLHYFAVPSDPDHGVFAAGAHTDYGLFTVLKTDMVPGLELQLDGQWVPVAPIKDAFIVNLGDMMQRMTNGVFTSAKHRVITTGEERWSIPCFFDCSHHVMVEVLPQCCTPDNPARYPPINCGDYVLQKMKATFATTPEA